MDINNNTKSIKQSKDLPNENRRDFLKKLGLGVVALGVGGAVFSSKDALNQLVPEKKKKQTTGFGSGPYGV